MIFVSTYEVIGPFAELPTPAPLKLPLRKDHDEMLAKPIVTGLASTFPVPNRVKVSTIKCPSMNYPAARLNEPFALVVFTYETVYPPDCKFP